MSIELSLYADLLGDIKTRIRQAQVKATISANTEMILVYWDIGRMITERQEHEGWGTGVLRRLAGDLKNELPEIKGFSERNLKLMTQFYREYPDFIPIGQRPVAQLEPDLTESVFLTLTEPFEERELEVGLVKHLEKFLLELGQGFAFVGCQYRVEVSDKDFYIDLREEKTI